MHMLTLAAGLGAGFEVVIACQHDAAGMAFLGRAAARGLRIKALDLEDLPAFERWLKDSGAALLHVHAGIGWEGHGVVRIGKAAGLPVVRTEHLPYLLTSPVQQAEYRAMQRSVDHSIAVSQAVFDSHLDRGVARQSVVRNGICPPQPSSSSVALRAELGLPPEALVVLTVARQAAQKGLDVLVSAAPAVLKANPDVRFVLVGSGPERAALQIEIAERNLNNSFALPGSRDDIADFLDMADLFVLPSHFEGLPLALLEAMAAGVPVVATAIGGVIEAIGAQHPFLVPPGDPAALAGAIIDALGQSSARAAATEAAAARFASQFTAERMAAETAAIYASLLSKDPIA